MEKHRLLPGALTILIVAVMLGASELLNEREIIFPEIAAIAVGMLLAPQRPWRTDRVRVLALISLSAAIGLAVSVLLPLPLPLWVKMSAAFLLAQGVLVFGGTTFAPLISAAVLPVMLGTTSPVYLIAAVSLTALILLVSLLLERLGVRTPAPYRPVPPPDRHGWGRIVLRSALGVACIAMALELHVKFAVAPPMLVAFTEFMNPENKAKQKPVKTISLMTLCALAGAVSRLVLTMTLGLPLTVAAIAAAGALLWLLRAFQMLLPPAGALAILAMLIPESSVLLYPAEILVGVSVLTGLAKLTDTLEAHRAHSGVHLHP